MNTKRIYNGVAHDINIVSGATLDTSIRKFVGGEVTQTIPKMVMLNAAIDTQEVGEINGIPVFEMTVGSCDSLPEGYDVYVVSPIYAQAYVAANGPDSRLFTVGMPVMSDDGKTFRGCRGIVRYCK